MPGSLKLAKKVYDKLKNDRFRATAVRTLEILGVRKDMIRMDLNDVCNIECIMCNNKLKKITKDNFMSLDDIKIIMDKRGK